MATHKTSFNLMNSASIEPYHQLYSQSCFDTLKVSSRSYDTFYGIFLESLYFAYTIHTNALYLYDFYTIICYYQMSSMKSSKNLCYLKIKFFAIWSSTVITQFARISRDKNRQLKDYILFSLTYIKKVHY